MVSDDLQGWVRGLEYARSELDQHRLALQLALMILEEQEPPDSRAVSDEFVAMGSVLLGFADEKVMGVIEKAIAERGRS